jgi:hypothetical protein
VVKIPDGDGYIRKLTHFLTGSSRKGPTVVTAGTARRRGICEAEENRCSRRAGAAVNGVRQGSEGRKRRAILQRCLRLGGMSLVGSWKDLRNIPPTLFVEVDKQPNRDVQKLHVG